MGGGGRSVCNAHNMGHTSAHFAWHVDTWNTPAHLMWGMHMAHGAHTSHTARGHNTQHADTHFTQGMWTHMVWWHTTLHNSTHMVLRGTVFLQLPQQPVPGCGSGSAWHLSCLVSPEPWQEAAQAEHAHSSSPWRQVPQARDLLPLLCLSICSGAQRLHCYCSSLGTSGNIPSAQSCLPLLGRMPGFGEWGCGQAEWGWVQGWPHYDS